jgi:hypothetical protein
MELYKLLLINSKMKKVSIILLLLCMIFFLVMSIIKLFSHGHVTAIYYLLIVFLFWNIIKEII